MKYRSLSRRSFLRTSALTASFPLFLRSSVLGREGAVAPSDTIAIATIGHGNRCADVIRFFLQFDEVRCIAVSDSRAERRAAGKAQVDRHYGNGDCVTYTDFRELLARPDLDAVLIATGDRWHALASILAARAGKDVYSEKPMTMTIEEGRALVETMQRLGTVYQCGHQRRSVDSYRFQVEIAQSGRIGRFHTVVAQMWENPVLRPQAPQPVPPGLDYDMWLGPTPWHPYIPERINGWNWFWDTGGGTLINMGCHYTDIAQWGLDTDDTGPVHYEGTAEFVPGNFADIPRVAQVNCTYADGRKLVLRSYGAFGERFIRFIGDEGWIQVDDETNVVTAEPASILKRREVSAKSWADPGGHIGNFLRCVRTRQETICSPEKSHRATTIGHIANICIRLGQELTWDPKTETFLNSDQANRMISRSMRTPWHL
ncbi:MAG: Gfo/Idh/MocA family oxidoreductase [Sedimentisphaerales bacterium]|nr:Gfo/Idh/MocA family oxidoreductase [Sedimentisphaerales bacterium]